MPVKNPAWIAQKFGPNPLASINKIYTDMGMVGHNGWDIVGGTGQDCRAAHDGIVTFAGVDSGGGIGIVIRTEEPMEDTEGNQSYFKSIYWHLLPGSIKVTVGTRVKVGDIIGRCDSSGPNVTGSHVHFGLKKIAPGESEWVWDNINQNNGYFGAIDPEPYFSNYFAEDFQKIGGIMQQLLALLKKLTGK